MSREQLTFREGLLPAASTSLTLKGIVLEGKSSSSSAGRLFSCELGGSSASLLATGVESLVLAREGVILVLGKELALVVSFKCVVEAGGVSDPTFDSEGDAVWGDDFWKKETIDRCLVAVEAVDLDGTGLAGVLAPAVPGWALPAMVEIR